MPGTEAYFTWCSRKCQCKKKKKNTYRMDRLWSFELHTRRLLYCTYDFSVVPILVHTQTPKLKLSDETSIQQVSVYTMYDIYKGCSWIMDIFIPFCGKFNRPKTAGSIYRFMFLQQMQIILCMVITDFKTCTRLGIPFLELYLYVLYRWPCSGFRFFQTKF